MSGRKKRRHAYHPVDRRVLEVQGLVCEEDEARELVEIHSLGRVLDIIHDLTTAGEAVTFEAVKASGLAKPKQTQRKGVGSR